MRNLKRLTRFQKECCSAQGYDPTKYGLYKDINDSYFQIMNRETGKVVTIDKYRRGNRKEQMY